MESLAIRPPTKSRVRRVVAGGQWREALRSRLAKAAERQGGAAVPNVRGENTMFNARNNISATECVFTGRIAEEKEDTGSVSISVIRLSGRIMAYSREMKSVKSMFSASPKIGVP